MICPLLLLSTHYATATEETSSSLAKQLQAVMATNIKGITEKKLDIAMSVFHSKSPDYTPTKDATKQILQTYNIKIRLLSLQVIGSDQEYAVARVKYETTQDRGPAFRNNVSDTMQVFKKEGNQWKLWTSATLNIKYL